MSYYLKKEVGKNEDFFLYNEWLETDGAGGWASSTLSGAHSRRYHGLLVAAVNAPAERKVLLSKLNEKIICGNQEFDLSCDQYVGGGKPIGLEYLQEFKKDIFPEWIYTCGDIKLKKTVIAIRSDAVIIVQYQLLIAPSPIILELLPLVAGRDYHGLMHANKSIHEKAELSAGLFSFQPYDCDTRFYIQHETLEFEDKPLWYYNFSYQAEQDRGQDFTEDLFTPGVLRVHMKPGDIIELVIGIGKLPLGSAAQLISHEQQNRLHILKDLAVDDFSSSLLLATGQFIINGSQGEGSIIAGYHWFTAWGRDTMISLPGLCLVTRRFVEAKQILRHFAANISQGIIPNRFLDNTNAPEYNTCDATLWFFIACYKYQQSSGDIAFIEHEMLPAFRSIVEWHEKGTYYSIHVDDDGLLYAGEDGIQLTWMDAKVDDWVVTPRTGKAVEINALWYNLLMIYAEYLLHFGFTDDSQRYSSKAEQVKIKFTELFWYDQGGYLYDVVKGEDKDSSFRPNQVFAVSLPFSLLNREHSIAMLTKVKERLVTPRGLRSLAPGSINYHEHYAGDKLHRDSAYHQGTVWSWLLGPYIDSAIRLYGAAGKQEAVALIESFKPHLCEAGIGTISEIFDATAPFYPKGCIAQAWSVAEVLRVYMDYKLYLL